MPETENTSSEELLARPLMEAVDRLNAAADTGPVNDLLSRLPELGPRALRAAVLVAATVHARGSVEQLRDVLQHLSPWLQEPPDELQQRGDIDAARAVLSEILSTLRDVRAKDQKSLYALGLVARVAGEFAERAGDLASATEHFSNAARAFEELGDEVQVVVIHINIALIFWRAGDADAATEHLDHAAERFAESKAAQAQAGLHEELFQSLAVMAESLYYERQQPELAARLATHATRLEPDQADAWRLLANILARLERFEGAARAYARVAEMLPQDASSRANLAVALVNLGRRDDALRAVDDSLALSPNEVRPLVLRGQLRAQAGDAAGAASDLTTVLDLLEADRPTDDGTDDGRRRYREHWSMWMAAYHNLVAIHRERGDRDALERTAVRLIATGDDALTAMGHRLKGELALEDGRMTDARDAYDAALQAFPLDSNARQSRAVLAAEMGDVDSAIRDLAALAPREASPRSAIEGLEALRARFDRPEILRWLGFAQFEAGEFDGSDANLAAYLERVPNDVEARRWLGLSLISIERTVGDDGGPDLRRLVRGLEELARAASAGDAEGRDAFLWLLDRLMVAGERFLWAIGGSKPVEEALPGIWHVLDLYSRAWDFVTPSRDWAAGLAALTECIDEATALGLRCCTTYWQATAADWLLLMGRLEEARQHAHLAMQLRTQAFIARSAHLREQFEAQGYDTRAGDAGLEVEHLHVYGLMVPSLDDASATMARVLAQAGDREAALEVLGDGSAFIARADRSSATAAVVAAEVLRNVGRADDALAVLERAEARASSDDELASVITARSTALASLGRLQEAAESLSQAEPLIDDSRRWVLLLNAASYAQAFDLNEEALDLLSTVDVEGLALIDEDRFAYHYLRAVTLEQLGRLADAQESALLAVEILEDLRGRLKDLDLRASWTGKQEAAFALAVRVAASNGYAALAFDLCERSRSRQLVDEMAIGRSALDEEGRSLQQRLLDAEARRDVLAAIAVSPRPDLILRLRRLDPGLKLLEIGSDGDDRVSATALTQARARVAGDIERLRSDIAERRVASATRLFGSVAELQQVRELLGRSV